MGQRQSTGAAAEPAAPIKTSYYELLGLERQATEEDIKKAYRRKALELHPDRNYGKEEEATKLFAEISTAYEVLSDPQERAWYDSHESAILRGTDVGGEDHYEGSVRVTTAEEVIAMIGIFNGRVRFDDSPEGFFGFLRDSFAKLAKEEEIAGDLEGLDIPDYPTFGHKDDTHEDVVQDFYRGWTSFSTCKTFAWRDQYRLNEAPDRRIKRLMEKENKKRREEGIREFNDAVRALVAFVRKRDTRYTPNTRSVAEREKAFRDASAAQAARARAANAAKMGKAVPEWAQSREAEDDEEEDKDDEESEVEEKVFECVACRKTFKSEKQYEAHERSKKHQKSVYALKKKMQKDNAALNLDKDEPSSGFATPNGQDAHSVDDEAEEASHDLEDLNIEDASPSSDAESETLVDNDPDSKSPPKDSTKPSSSSPAPEEDSPSDPDSDYATREEFASRLSTGNTTTDPPAPVQKKLGKAAQKRAKKAAKAEEAEDSAEASEAGHKCQRCNATFGSRTKLFEHIKKVGHAALVSEVGGGKSRKKK